MRSHLPGGTTWYGTTVLHPEVQGFDCQVWGLASPAHQGLWERSGLSLQRDPSSYVRTPPWAVGAAGYPVLSGGFQSFTAPWNESCESVSGPGCNFGKRNSFCQLSKKARKVMNRLSAPNPDLPLR